MLLALSLLAGCTSTARAQEVVLLSGLERDVNQYQWRMGLESRAQAGPWAFTLDNRFSSDAFILFEDRLRFRDENQLRWRAERPLGRTTRSISDGRLSYFGQSRVLIQHAYSGIEYRPGQAFRIQPALGIAWDQRPGGVLTNGIAPLRSDAGPAAALELDYRPRLDDAYAFNLEAAGNYHAIQPRRGYTVSVRASGGASYDETSLESRLRYGSARRDVYQSASFLNRGLPTDRLSETIEATSSDTLVFGVGIDAPVVGGLLLTGSIEGTMMRRYIRTHRAPSETLHFDTDLNRRAVDFEAGLAYAGTRRSGDVMLQLGADSEVRRLANRDRLPAAQAAQRSLILQQADFERSVVSLRSRFRSELGPRASVRLESLFSIVRRDTPDINADDRDEAYHNASAAVTYRWSQHLESELALFGSYFHTVYLNAARSAENNVQQSLRLRPLVRWTPGPATRVELRSEVRATYTVDDFTLPGRRPTDQSAREMRFEIDFRRELGAGFRVLGEAGHTDLRLGRLLWDSFAEIPFDTLQTYSGWLRVEAGERLVSELGIRYFIRSDFNRSLSVRYPAAEDRTAFVSRPGREWIRQIGPTAGLRARLGRGSEFRFSGWLNVQRITQNLYGELPPEDGPAIRAAARGGTRLVIPNLSLSLRWRL